MDGWLTDVCCIFDAATDFLLSDFLIFQSGSIQVREQIIFVVAGLDRSTE